MGADSKPAGDILAGPILGPLTVAHGASQLSSHPTRGLHEMISGTGQTLALPAAVAFPGTLAYSAPSIIAQTGVTAGSKKLGFSDDTSNLLGDIAGVGAGVGLGKGLSTEEPNATGTTSNQEKAFNVLHPENGSATNDSILPTIRNAAAQQDLPTNWRGNVRVPGGNEGVEFPQKVIQNAIDAHEAQVAAVKEPFVKATQDNTPAANAALDMITPEMRLTAASDPGVAKEVSQIQAIANRAQNANTIGLSDQLRHSWNDDLDAYYNKPEASQDVAASAIQAKQAAAAALRKTLYNNLADLSGRDDVRNLAQTEGKLIEAKAGVAKTGKTVMENGKGNDKSFLGRVLTGSDRDVGGVSSVVPAKASAVEIPLNILRAMGNKDFGTPKGDYIARVKRSFSNLGEPVPAKPLYQTPPNASSVPDTIRGLLPENTPSTLELPAQPLSTTSAGRTFDAPGAADEHAVPQLIQNFIEGKTQSSANPVIKPSVSLGYARPVTNAPGVSDYPILDASGNRLGHARIAIGSDGTAEVGWLGPDNRAGGAPLNLGAGGVKELMRQFSVQNPEIKRFTGKKLSGAHATETGHGTQTIPLPKQISSLIFPSQGDVTAT